MIRPFTCLCLLIAAGSGLYLYSAKHDAQMLDRDITRLGRQAQDSRARAAMMRAEYDRLGDPDRLRELAAMVLSLQPTDPVQFVAMADLERRLQSVNAGVQANPPPFEPAQAMASAAEPARTAVAPLALSAASVTPVPIVPEKPSLPERTVAERPAPPIQTAPAKPVSAPKPAAPPSAPAPQIASTSSPMAPAAYAPSGLAAPAPSVLASAQPTPRAPLVRPAAAESRPALRPAPLVETAMRPVRPGVPQDGQANAQSYGQTNAASAPAAPVFASSLGMARTQAPLPANVLTPTIYAPPRR